MYSGRRFPRNSQGSLTCKLSSRSVAQEAELVGASVFSLNLSDRCVARLREIHEARRREQQSATDGNVEDRLFVALRVSVDSGGCSGFQYNFKLESDASPRDDDIVVEKDGMRVLIDSVSAPMLDGATVDYEQELMRSAFVIGTNPNSDTGCSCGVSFSPKF